MKRKNGIKMYNVVFPIWLLWLFPLTWIIILPANFIIDSLVVLITLKLLKVNNTKSLYKKSILKVWWFGFLSDLIGALILLVPELMGKIIPANYSARWDKLTSAISYYPFESIYSFLWVIVAIVVTSFFIYLFNYKASFVDLDMEEDSKKKLALSLAICTAPYLFMLPTAWFF